MSDSRADRLKHQVRDYPTLEPSPGILYLSEKDALAFTESELNRAPQSAGCEYTLRLALYWLNAKNEVGADFANKAAADVLRNALVQTAQPSAPVCAMCGQPATCFGRYEAMTEDVYACDGCCGHGCEDGRCTPVAKPSEPSQETETGCVSEERMKAWIPNWRADQINEFLQFGQCVALAQRQLCSTADSKKEST